MFFLKRSKFFHGVWQNKWKKNNWERDMTIKIICPLALRMKFLKEQNNFGIYSIHSNDQYANIYSTFSSLVDALLMFWVDKQLKFKIVESHQKEVSFEGSWLSCMAPVEVDQKQDAWFSREAFKSMLVRYSIYNKIQSQKFMIKNANSNSYSTISASMRSELIDLVQVQSYSVSQAAGEVGIKLSTAKQILKRYRTTGTIYLRKQEKKKTPKEVQNSPFPPKKLSTASIKNSGEIAEQTPQTTQSSHPSVPSGQENTFLQNCHMFMTPSGPLIFYFY